MTKDAIRLNIFFARMNEFDHEGIIEIRSNGYPDEFVYSGAGDVMRFNDKNIPDGPEMLAMCDEIKRVIQKYFPIEKMPKLYDLNEYGEEN